MVNTRKDHYHFHGYFGGCNFIEKLNDNTMKKLFRKLFPKYQYKHIAFQTGTSGMRRHADFMAELNYGNIEIINSFIEYHHDYKNNHLPAYINYVIKIKKTYDKP
jgi:hypothetical protein